MKKARVIKGFFSGIPTIEGAGVHLNRIFGHSQVPLFDPFLLLDHFHSDNPDFYLKGFPWHPHRGIETISYLLDGSLKHGDSLGNSGNITSGDVQWMTAGSGIIHHEMPKGDIKKRLNGFQLWANLPADMKMVHPRYQDLKSSKIPVVHGINKSICRIIAGKMDNVEGPVSGTTIDPVYFDIWMPAETEFVYPTPSDHNFFCYIFEGNGCFGSIEDSGSVSRGSSFSRNGLYFIKETNAVRYSEGDFISVTTDAEPVRFLLVGGKPLNEPVAWYGPIVMNTDNELQKAFEEFQIGTFLKH